MVRPSCSLLFVLLGCAPSDAPLPDPAGTVRVGPEVPVSPDATAGFDRLVDATAARGLAVELEYPADAGECPEILGNVVVSDLDDDGDPDLLLHRAEGFPLLFANDGGAFTQRTVPHSLIDRFGRGAMSFAAVDLDGDRLPEVVVTGPSLVVVARNLGGLQFADFEVLWEDPAYPRSCLNTQVWGDIDADGDLDLVLPGTMSVLNEGSTFDYWSNTPPDGGLAALDTQPIVLEQIDGQLARRGLLTFTDDQEGTVCIAGAFTDLDQDADLDLILSSHSPFPPLPPGTAFRNTAGAFTNVGPDWGIQFEANGMGIDVADLDGDGRQDVCLSDAQPRLVCLMSAQGGDAWVDRGLAAGLVVDVSSADGHDAADPVWDEYSGWSVEFVDLDADGALDVALVGGGAPHEGVHMDALWRGRGDGTFEDRTASSGFGSLRNHYGLGAGDFDGDGTRDLVIAGWTGQPTFWWNPPSPHSWTAVELEGPAGNAQGFGAQVALDVAGERIVRELHALRGLGQSEAAVHVGLGSASLIDALEVRFADGAVVVASDLPVNRRLTVVHPGL